MNPNDGSEQPTRMSNDHQTVENWDQSHCTDRVSQEPAVAQAKKREGQDASYDVSAGLDRQKITIVWIEQRHAKSQASV
jgi:hypothetical protein